MAQYFDIHPDNPQERLLRQAAALLRQGGVAALPTDSSYAFVCHLNDKSAADHLRQLRGVDDKHHLTLLCRDLKELSVYAKVDNAQFRMIKAGTPGPFTFILQATKEVPRRLSHPKRLTIGLRVPAHPAVQCLLGIFGEPLLATTLIPMGQSDPLNDPETIRSQFEKQIACIIDAGACSSEPTTVIDMTGSEPEILRQGRGNPALLGF